MKLPVSSLAGIVAVALELVAAPVNVSSTFISAACAQGPGACEEYEGTEHFSACLNGCVEYPFDTCISPDFLIAEEDWTCALPQFGCEE